MSYFTFSLSLLLRGFMSMFCFLVVCHILHAGLTLLSVPETWFENHGRRPGSGSFLVVCLVDLFRLTASWQAAVIFLFLDAFETFSYGDDLISCPKQALSTYKQNFLLAYYCC